MGAPPTVAAFSRPEPPGYDEPITADGRDGRLWTVDGGRTVDGEQLT